MREAGQGRKNASEEPREGMEGIWKKVGELEGGRSKPNLWSWPVDWRKKTVEYETHRLVTRSSLVLEKTFSTTDTYRINRWVIQGDSDICVQKVNSHAEIRKKCPMNVCPVYRSFRVMDAWQWDTRMADGRNPTTIAAVGISGCWPTPSLSSATSTTPTSSSKWPTTRIDLAEFSLTNLREIFTERSTLISKNERYIIDASGVGRCPTS